LFIDLASYNTVPSFADFYFHSCYLLQDVWIYARVANLFTDHFRFQLRRSALRVLSSSSSSYLAKPRTFTTFCPSIRVSRQFNAVAFQRRWATGEAEAKKEEETAGAAPISEIQATPAEEVENAIQSDNAAESAVDSEVQASESATSEAVQSNAPAEAEQSAVDSAVDSVKESASNAAEAVKQTAQDAVGATTGAAPTFGRKRPDRAASAREGASTPKPTIYIGNLFFDVTENDLVKELARFGTILKCRLMRDSRGLSKGYA
jgi:nucleolin